MAKSRQYYIRKTHRYLGLFLGIQFLFWTASGLYFSWTNIDDIHGDQYRDFTVQPASFSNLISPSKLEDSATIRSVELRDINGAAYYWINKEALYNAETGAKKNGITKEEALIIASRNMRKDLAVKDISLIDSVGKKDEYRGKPLPVYVISYNDPKDVKAYVSLKDGAFQTVRHRDWRWYDFLWMTHIMDYDGREIFNNWPLRIFSLMGLITVISGFLLWFITSRRIKRILNRNND